MAPMRIMLTTHLLGGFGLAAATVAALWMTLTPPVAPPVGLVLITLDTTRVDRLSPYGFLNVSLPNLERLARESVIFDQATSVAPLTLPAHTSLFTGLLPPNHRVRDNADPALDETHTTLAEALFARGFRTGAFVGSVVLDPDRGLTQGFEQYRGVNATHGQTSDRRERRADQVIAEAVQWLDTIGTSRFLLWAHLYDPHLPYDPPEPYASIYGHDPYVGEIAFADSQIGRLLEALEQRALLDRTIVIVAGDHGESLGERGERDHGVFIYENVLRVPLMVRARALAPFRVGGVVRLTDVMPTVLDLLDVPAPPVDGVSLVELIRGRWRELDLEAYSESLYPERFGWSPLRALRDGRFKLIDAPRPELYDLEHDPFEEQNLYDTRRVLADALTRRVRALSSRGSSAHGVVDSKTAVPADLRERLAALGYVGSGTPRVSPHQRPLPDPKDCITLYNRRDEVSGTAAIADASRCN